MKWEKFPFKIEKRYRLKDWDYSGDGCYFVTICTQDRLNLFRNVGTDPRVRFCFKQKGIVNELNLAGKMIEKWWIKIPTKYNEIILDKFVVMPNHVHGILIIKNTINNEFYFDNERTHGSVPTLEQNNGSVPTLEQNIFGNVGLLGQSIQWFKTMTTNEYIKNIKQNNWPKFSKRLWQSRFHDRISRNEKELWVKRKYIENNPINWNKDRNNV